MVVVAGKRELTPAERVAQKAFWDGLTLTRRKTDKPIIVAIVGLVGSGKSEVAQALSKHLGAIVIENDRIRVELRKQKASYDRTWVIAENLAIRSVINEGGSNVILDSDFVDEKKRASIRERVRRTGAHLVFVRTICDFDVMSQRIRENDPGEFFNSAGSKSTAGDKGKDVKFREMIRRQPHHYRWIKQNGGKWVLKKLPFAIFAEIDTTDLADCERQVKTCAERLIATLALK